MLLSYDFSAGLVSLMYAEDFELALESAGLESSLDDSGLESALEVPVLI